MPTRDIQPQIQDVAPQYGTIPVYYTGLIVHATAGSRTASTGTPVGGDVVCYDPYGHDKGRGKDVTKPYTANLMFPAGVVVSVGPADASGGRWLQIVPFGQRGAVMSVNTKANMTLGVTRLGPADDAFSLAAVAASVASAIAADAAAVKQVALPCETSNTSSTAARKFVQFT